MKAVERLMNEHELIERGLSLLEKAVARIKAGQSLPDGFPQWTARFL
jgi:hemerythrin-like domain-containing protein